MERIITMKQDGFQINNDEAHLDGFADFLVHKQLPKGIQCTAGFTTITVDYELNVRSCWPKGAKGNLHTSRLIDIWRSDSYRQQRASMLALDCPKCWLRCHTDYLSLTWLSDLLIA
jgi:MoaA/NifB/PqqE/SkfB family radical SAM enzyme